MGQTVNWSYAINKELSWPKYYDFVRVDYSTFGEVKGGQIWSADDFLDILGDVEPGSQFTNLFASKYTSKKEQIYAAAIKKTQESGLNSGHWIDFISYKEGDPYPKDSDPNQEGEDPTPANAPTEDEEGGIIEPVEAIEPIAGITPIDAGLLPTTQPTLAPLQQGVGLNDAVALLIQKDLKRK